MAKEYTEQEKASILEQEGIVLLNGMLTGGQAAKVLSHRAKIETGKEHKYSEDTIRRHVKNKRLAVAQRIHERMNLFNVDDVFALKLDSSKWRADQPKKRVRKKTDKIHAQNP